MPRCECGREVWNSLLIGATCTVCLDTMRLNDALAELERYRAVWAKSAAVLLTDRFGFGHAQVGTFRIPAQRTLDDLLDQPKTFPSPNDAAIVMRIVRTIEECRADIEAAGGQA